MLRALPSYCQTERYGERHSPFERSATVKKDKRVPNDKTDQLAKHGEEATGQMLTHPIDPVRRSKFS